MHVLINYGPRESRDRSNNKNNCDAHIVYVTNRISSVAPLRPQIQEECVPNGGVVAGYCALNKKLVRENTAKHRKPACKSVRSGRHIEYFTPLANNRTLSRTRERKEKRKLSRPARVAPA